MAINTFINVDKPTLASQLLKAHFNISSKQKENKLYFFAEKENRAKIIKLLTSNKIEVYGIGNVKVALEQKFLSSIKHNDKGAK